MSKGSRQRPYDRSKWDAEFERIFGGPPTSERYDEADGTIVRTNSVQLDETNPDKVVDTNSQRD